MFLRPNIVKKVLNMKFREAVLSDLSEIMKIIKAAQKYLKSQNIEQWQNNYPNAQSIKEDINNSNAYVLDDSGEIAAYTALIFGEDKTYKKIYQGNWLNDKDYAVIHRMAAADGKKGKGLGSILFKEAEKVCIKNNINSIRVDTHRDNLSMQRLIEKNDYKYCGIIYTEENAERLAYQKDF